MAKEYARVEIMGFRVHYGRISEVERFGAKMLRVDEFKTVPKDGEDEVFQTFFYGPSAIFGVQPMTEEACWDYVRRNEVPPAQPRLRYLQSDVFGVEASVLEASDEEECR